jgi:hypothetical protein
MFTGLNFGACIFLFRKRNIYEDPSSEFPFYKAKKVRKVNEAGKILKQYPKWK